ncbi:MAG TPA: LacI family DNA-binding transcriptional regulator [Opitutaceae bacterium]|nr:LacI family DNA-binding transcriptional regulator [Opitutaceae bacterium]
MSLPQRFNSLPNQVAGLLRDEIDRGAWTEWLPGERALTSTLQVSRKTLRKALVQLRGEGLISSEHGLGNRIVPRGKRTSASSHQDASIVALLTPEPLEQMRPYTSLWVNHLKTLLGEKGIRLRAFDGQKYFSRHPENALARLVSQSPAACWLLANATEATQRWFPEKRIRCVLAGSCHPGVDLPQADLDHYALCRHAAGVLLSAGHRRVALLNGRTGRAGDAESEAGFIAGVRESPHSDAVPLVVHHEYSPASLSRALNRLLEISQPPTALLVSNAASYLTVISVLAQRGLRVPRDVSVISRDDEPFLSALVPTPGRYSVSPNAFAKKLLRPIMQVISGEAIMPRKTLILPQYVKGGSLGTLRGTSAA